MNIFENKTILVTGATGLLGSNIVHHVLRAKCSKVFALGRTENKLKETFGTIENLSFIAHDVSTQLPENLGQIDYIFHAASPISGEVIKNAPLDVINSNLSGTINCLEFLRKQGFGKMIIFSSATVYNAVTATNNIVSESQTSYADPIDGPNAPYSESKRMIEVIANSYHKQHCVDVIIARFSYLYGYSKNPAKTAFYEFIFKALAGKNIELNKSGLPRRDNIYVDDAVEALMHLCEIGINGEAYNISSCGDKGNYAAIDEIAESIARGANKINDSKIRVIYKTEGGERKEGLRLDNTKLKASGFTIKTTLDAGIEQILLKYKEQA